MTIAELQEVTEQRIYVNISSGVIDNDFIDNMTPKDQADIESETVRAIYADSDPDYTENLFLYVYI